MQRIGKCHREPQAEKGKESGKRVSLSFFPAFFHLQYIMIRTARFHLCRFPLSECLEQAIVGETSTILILDHVLKTSSLKFLAFLGTCNVRNQKPDQIMQRLPQNPASFTRNSICLSATQGNTPFPTSV